MTRAALALGANLGDRLAALQGAVDLLASTEGIRVEAVSAVFETDPVGGPEQPDYLNGVVVIETTLTPETLLACAHEIEATYARVRDVRWGARTLDVDLLAVDDERRDTAALTLPHPRAHERVFVLAPWATADPAAHLPGRGSVSELLAALAPDGPATAGVRRRDDLVLARQR